MDTFEYEIEVKNVWGCKEREIGNYWAVIEEFILPESLVSDKGAFMFKLIEDNKSFKDVWILVIPHTKSMLFSFLKGKINYAKFLKNSKLFVVYWDLNKNEVCIQKAVRFSDLKKINNRVEYILKWTIMPSDSLNLEKILNYLGENVSQNT